MPHREDLDGTYMGTALLHAKLSKAVRAKVGAVLVTRNGVTLTGYNGTPIGNDNNCERIDHDTGELITKDSVIHAELNCILKAAREGVSCVGATVYVTLQPCERCSAMMINAGVREVVYLQDYKTKEGINLLLNSGILVRKLK